MMLFLAITAAAVSISIGVLIGFANGSDAPTEHGASLRPVWIGLAISAVLFVCWWNGW